ncbi:hypothetical protein ALC62_03414 [Cyphomyrmex costatus]|uniref:Uncharacterized protein n=1 Tax=Cyphomyrmex costatus TaxID=456900 RepID=A0A195CYA2_9HYME|nr:hypothetical protein ALC62_03414 [Cyphomyrmex costatus]
MQILKLLGLTIGPNLHKLNAMSIYLLPTRPDLPYCLETDTHCIKFSERSLSDAAQEAKSSLKSAKKTQENLNVENEIYGAGIAD